MTSKIGFVQGTNRDEYVASLSAANSRDSQAAMALSVVGPLEGMDLLSVLMHELGHELGMDHDEELGGVMRDRLDPGLRATVAPAIADQVIGQFYGAL